MLQRAEASPNGRTTGSGQLNSTGVGNFRNISIFSCFRFMRNPLGYQRPSWRSRRSWRASKKCTADEPLCDLFKKCASGLQLLLCKCLKLNKGDDAPHSWMFRIMDARLSIPWIKRLISSRSYPSISSRKKVDEWSSNSKDRGGGGGRGPNPWMGEIIFIKQKEEKEEKK